jgi:hypothetical protein
MGTEGAKSVVREFVGEEAALQVHRFHPMVGILLYGPLDDLMDQYMLGFYHNTVSNDIYMLKLSYYSILPLRAIHTLSIILAPRI